MSARPSQEISLEERRYNNGQDPNLLDIISIKMKAPQPQFHQKENHLIDDQFYWVKEGTLGWQRLQSAVESSVSTLWINGHSTRIGQNDRVPESLLEGLPRSLHLIRPQQLSLIVSEEGGDFGPPRRRVRAQFSLGGLPYRLVVTDPWIENAYLANRDGEYSLDEALLCVSLGEVFKKAPEKYAYKLVASVITPQRAEA